MTNFFLSSLHLKFGQEDYLLTEGTHLDGIDQETMEVIDQHWGSFQPQTPVIGHVIAIAYFILLIINITGNGSIIYIFTKVNLNLIYKMI